MRAFVKKEDDPEKQQNPDAHLLGCTENGNVGQAIEISGKIRINSNKIYLYRICSFSSW